MGVPCDVKAAVWEPYVPLTKELETVFEDCLGDIEVEARAVPK